MVNPYPHISIEAIIGPDPHKTVTAFVNNIHVIVREPVGRSQVKEAM